MGRAIDGGAYAERQGDRIDLRRRRETDQTDRLVRRAHWLEPSDRELVLAVFERGQSAAAIAGMSGEPVRRIRKHIRQLVARLNDPRVAYVVAHHNAWGKTMQGVGKQFYIQGRTMREVSEQLGISLHCVRKNRDAIEAMAASQQPSRPSRAWQRTRKGD